MGSQGPFTIHPAGSRVIVDGVLSEIVGYMAVVTSKRPDGATSLDFVWAGVPVLPPDNNNVIPMEKA